LSLKAKYEDKVYGITTTLDFGKYKGYTVGNILELDPDYLIWAMGAVKEFKLTYSTKQLLFENPTEENFLYGYLLNKDHEP